MFTFVPTPIGNLGDITLRAIEALKSSDYILAEDPRVTGQLLEKLSIPKKPMMSYGGEFDYTKLEPWILEHQHEQVSIVTDAGIPGISDPGYTIVDVLQSNDIQYTFLPGASAGVTAAAASGLVGKEYLFLGFLPLKKGRQSTWQSILVSDRPVIIYESVHRIDKCIAELIHYLEPNREIFIAREMTKLHETYWKGKVSNLQDYKGITKGEFVLVIGPNTTK
jgi:16S rRNA (cytidine1402-2'-O)-methyltransferase